MTSLYSHDIILVLFHWIMKQGYKEKIVTEDWSQSSPQTKWRLPPALIHSSVLIIVLSLWFFTDECMTHMRTKHIFVIWICI